MAKKTATVLSANNAGLFITTIKRRPEAHFYKVTILAYGTWGSGTISWKISPNNGTTLIPIKDLSGTAITSTADDSINLEFGNATHNGDNPKIYAVLAGATNPTINIISYDNN